MDESTLNAMIEAQDVNGVELVRGLFDYNHNNDISGAIEYIKSVVKCDDETAKEMLGLLFPKFGKDSPTPAPQEDVVHCPKCNSTQIQMVQRKWSLLTGFFTNKVDRVCVNCKHKW